MVLFILTRAGYEDMRRLIEAKAGLLWLNKDVLSGAEISALRSSGADVSCFSYAIDPAKKQHVEAALATIAEHHPRTRIWVETYSEAVWSDEVSAT